MKIILYILTILIAIGIFVPAYKGIGRDYTKIIEVDSSEKIEWAISNAVHDVKSRDFVVKYLNVDYCWVDKTFRIECGGIERGNLLRK